MIKSTLTAILSFLVAITVSIPVLAQASLDVPAPFGNLVFNMDLGNSSAGFMDATLVNGMRVVAIRDSSSPEFVVRIFVKAGPLFEGELAGSGISHLTQRMIFPGAARGNGARKGSAEIEYLGGEAGGETGSEYTTFFIRTAAPFAKEAMRVLAGWISNPILADQDVREVKDRIADEIGSTLSDPSAVARRNLFGLMFRDHPQMYPIRGEKARLMKIEPRDLSAFHERMYIPENMVCVLVGDIDLTSIVLEAEKTFSSFAVQKGRPAPAPSESAYSNRRFCEAFVQSPATSLCMGFRTVRFDSLDVFPLDVLAEILGGEDGFLSRRLSSDDRLASKVRAVSYTPLYGEGMMILEFELAGARISELVATVEKSMSELAALDLRMLVSSAKASLMDKLCASSENLAGRTLRIGLESMGYGTVPGDTAAGSAQTAGIEAVTADDLKRVVEQYFISASPMVSVAGPMQGQPVTLDGNTKGYFLETIPNGIRIMCRETPFSGKLDLVAVLFGGIMQEPEGKTGLSSLMAALLTRGSAGFTPERINGFLAATGARFKASAGMNTITLSMSCRADYWRDALAIFSDALKKPSFSAVEIDRMASMIYQYNRQTSMDPKASAVGEAMRSILGAGAGAGPFPGITAEVSSITRDDIVSCHSDWFFPEGIVVGVSGDIASEKIRAEVRAALGDISKRSSRGGWKTLKTSAGASKPDSDKTAAMAVPETVRKFPGATTDYALLGWRAPSVTATEYFAHRVLAVHLGKLVEPMAGMSGHALPGSEYLVLSTPERSGVLMIAEMPPGKGEEAMKAMKAAVARIARTGLSLEDLDRSRRMAVCGEILQNRDNLEKAERYAFGELLGIGADYFGWFLKGVESVDIESVKAAAASAEKALEAFRLEPVAGK